MAGVRTRGGSRHLLHKPFTSSEDCGAVLIYERTLHYEVLRNEHGTRDETTSQPAGNPLVSGFGDPAHIPGGGHRCTGMVRGRERWPADCGRSIHFHRRYVRCCYYRLEDESRMKFRQPAKEALRAATDRLKCWRRSYSLKAAPQGAPSPRYPRLPVFHEISRAAGPSQQATKTDGLSHNQKEMTARPAISPRPR